MVAVAATATALAGVSTASAQGVSHHRNVKMSLSKSIAPRPAFLVKGICGTRGPSNTTTCGETIIKSINAARKFEPLHPVASTFSLKAFEKLTYAEQIFAITDMERTSRGLAPIEGLTTQLNAIAENGAKRQIDPVSNLPLRLVGGGVATYFGSNWAEGTANALGSDYYWMYDDGPNSPNADCRRAGQAGCWGHRDNILGDYETAAYCPTGSQLNMVMGAAEVTSRVSFSPSIAEIFLNDCGKAPTMYFTWHDVVRIVFGQR